MKKALIIIDMQIMPFVWKDYGGKEIWNSDGLLRKVAGLIDKARAANAPVYYIMHTERGDSPRAEGQALWQAHPEIAPEETDRRILKYHPDMFQGTELEGRLKQEGIGRLVLCGIQTEYCVDTACRSAYAHGFETELAADGHSTFDSKELAAEQIICHHNEALAVFATVRPSAEIMF